MNKTEYMTAIETNLTAAEALCADLRKLRNLKKLTEEIPGSDALVSFDALDKAVEAKETTLKVTRAELGKARRIVKKFEDIEAMEAEDAQPSEGAPVQEPKAKKSITKSASKKKVPAKAAEEPKTEQATGESAA